MPEDRDPTLASLQDEMRVAMTALNELYHPVYPADRERLQALEREVAELRAAIRERRAQLARPPQPSGAD